MSALRARKIVLPCLALLWAGSCAVFPDQAELPNSADTGTGGEDVVGGAGVGAASSGGAGGSAEGGVPGSTAGIGTVSGAGAETSAGAAGERGCAAEQRRFSVEADTWIESAKPAAGHGNDPLLFVVQGAEERRALMSFTLPPAPPGSTLIRGVVRLQLESNADETFTERQLEVHLLEQAVDESRTTWNNYANGVAQQWTIPGGDFGPPLATAVIPVLTDNGPLTFDITGALAEAFSTQSVPLPLIVLEVGPEPTPPAELAFTSREGDASRAPALVVEYCP